QTDRLWFVVSNLAIDYFDFHTLIFSHATGSQKEFFVSKRNFSECSPHESEREPQGRLELPVQRGFCRRCCCVETRRTFKFTSADHCMRLLRENQVNQSCRSQQRNTLICESLQN